jgi:hypothetical protein
MSALIVLVPGLILADEKKREEKPPETLTIEQALEQMRNDVRATETALKEAEGNSFKEKKIKDDLFKKWNGRRLRLSGTIDKISGSEVTPSVKVEMAGPTWRVLFLFSADKEEMEKAKELNRGDKATIDGTLRGPEVLPSGEMVLEDCRIVDDASDKKAEVKRPAEKGPRQPNEESLEEDHKIILAYMKSKMPTEKSRTDFSWWTPVPAVTLKVDRTKNVFDQFGLRVNDGDEFVAEQGLLYRLQGKLGTGRFADVREKSKPAIFSYYFLVSGGRAIRWQEANSDKALTMCKILGEAAKRETVRKAKADTKRFIRPKTEEPDDAGQPAKFLSDMQEFDVKVHFKFAKKGNLGYSGGGSDRIKVNGKESPNGLSMHALSNDRATAKYKLGKTSKTFIASVALNDSAGTPGRPPGDGKIPTPLTFQVMGDGEVLWKSKPVDTARNVQECKVDVTGVDILELRVVCPGAYNNAQAVWLEPRLLLK